MKTVLVIDADLGATDEAAASLPPGCRVVQAFSGEEGLRMWEAEAPDVVIVEVAVPGLPGLAVVELLAARGTAPVVVTGPADVATVVEVMQVGASAYLLEPAHGGTLGPALAKALDEAELRREAGGRLPLGDACPRLGVSPRMADLARRAELAARSSDWGSRALRYMRRSEATVFRTLVVRKSPGDSPKVGLRRARRTRRVPPPGSMHPRRTSQCGNPSL